MDALGLFDLLAPYFLGGVDLGPALHTLLSTVQVDDYDSCYDEFGATLWGMARLDQVQTNPQFSTGFAHGGIWDWNDATFQFRIRVPRTPSTTTTTIVTDVSNAPPVLAKKLPFTALFNAWGYDSKHLPAPTETPPAVAPSDFPDTQFELDLLLTVATLHLPFLTGAKLAVDGLLEPDPTQTDVKFVLPKILLTLTQGATVGSVDLTLDSWGAETIDDPSDTGEAQLFQMIPPLALVKGTSSFGFGFDRCIIDTSDSHTPPELLAKFGIGMDWKGLYFPDLRIFFAPGGQTGFAADIDAHDLLIGLNDGFHLWGDFELDVINQDTNPYMRAVFYDTGGNTIAADCSTQRNSEFTIALPKDFTCAIEVHSAMPPYQIILDGKDITAVAGFTNHSLTAPIDYHLVAKAPNTPPDPHTGKDNTQATLLLHVVPQEISPAPKIKRVPSTAPLTLAPPPPQDIAHSIALVDSEAGKLQFSPGPPAKVQVTVTDNTGKTVFSQTLASTDTITQVPPPGKSWKVTATWAAVTGTPAPVEVKAWFHFDRPPKPAMPQLLPPGVNLLPQSPYGVPKKEDLADEAHIEIGTTKDSGNTGDFPEALRTSTQFQTFLAQIPPGATTNIEIRGFASYEHHDPMQQYNQDLSERRAIALAELIYKALQAKGSTATVMFVDVPKGNDQNDLLLPGGVSAKTAWGPGNTAASSYDPSEYWMAHAQYNASGTGTPAATVTAVLTAPPENTIVTQGPATIQPTTSTNRSRPDWFRYAKLLVRIEQSKFIALELSGELKFDTAANDLLQQQAGNASLKSHGNPDLTAKNLPGNSNPTDGTTDFDFILSHDDSTNTWAGQLTIAAGKNDKDGLLQFGQPPGDDSQEPNSSVWFNFFGASIVFAPLIDAVAKSVTNKGTLVKVGVDAGSVAAVGLIAASGVLQTETVTLYGGTLTFSGGDAGISSALMFDVEVALYLDVLGLVKTRPTKPVKVRYKSVGVKVASKDPGGHPLLPVYFDPSKGYDIDLTDPGTFKLPAGLDDIIQVVGARIARTNPLNLELDIAMKDDFGIVSIDRAKVRWPIREFGPPQLTALGVTIHIAGAFKASGYLDLSSSGVAGSLDMTIAPLGIRAMASINIQKADDGAGHTATGVAVSLLCQFSAPLVLGASGLGIYGFIGLFAMHFKRTEPDAAKWYMTVVHGDPTDVLQGWEASIGEWAFGAGLILGTLDGGIILNLKGVVILELPGPRLLFLMMANLLTQRPELATSAGGTIEATMDLDFGRQTITIGLKVDYLIQPFLEIVIPGNACFDFKQPDNFQLDLGTMKAPATVKVLEAFNGSGYLMIHGNGIPGTPLTGLSIAVGVSVQLIWGSTSVGLYLEVTGTAALGISFSKFFVTGTVSIEGSLHLFIVSIGASGTLSFASNGIASKTTLSGGICGSVSFFFFSVSGCVNFSIGPDTPPAMEVLDLMSSVYLQSRSPALLEGTGTDRPIDTKLLDAPRSTDDEAFAASVPIDAIPVLQFTFTPCLDKNFNSSTIEISGPPAPPATSEGWVRRGPMFFRYAITNIELVPINGTPSLGAKAPGTWRKMQGPPSGDDRGIEFALLSWTPFAAPSAVLGSSTLDTQVTTTFKNTCAPVAPAAAVLWTFTHSPVGPSNEGWLLTGIPAPDPPGTHRSSSPPLTLKVRELWRSKSTLATGFSAAGPGYVLSRTVPCGPGGIIPTGNVQDGIDFDIIAPIRPFVHSQAALSSIRTAVYNLPFAPMSPEISKLVSDGFPQILQGAQLANPPVAPFAPIVQPPRPLPIAPGDTAAPSQCPGKLLIAPFQHTGSSALPDGLAEALANAAIALSNPVATQNPDLFDALLFETQQPTRVRLMVWVASEIFRMRGMVLRPLDLKGNKLADIVVNESNTQISNDPSEAPPEWLQSPWVAESYPSDAAALQTGTYTVDGRFAANGIVLLLETDLPANTASFLLGLNQIGLAVAQSFPLSYAVAVVEAWSAAEVQRSSFDQTVQITQQSILAGALNNDPATLPLLAPNGQYSVTVTYTVQTAPVADNGQPGDPGAPPEPKQEIFFFQTDNAPPKVLDPWILTVWPSRDEPYFFYGEPVTVVFSTNALQPLLKAYGVSLQGHSRAASFRNADPNAKGPGKPVQELNAKPIGGLVYTPFEEALRNALATGMLPCINASGTATKHAKQTFDVPLDPLTGYIFDLEEASATPLPSSDMAQVKPMFRASFSTSRYSSWEEMVADIKGSSVKHRHAETGGSAALAALPIVCSQAQMDDALKAAGFGAMPPADVPVVTVLWEDVPNAKARAAGVLLDFPEPIRRSRPTPTSTKDPNPQMDPARNDRIVSWSLQPQVWMDLVEAVKAGMSVAQRLAINSAGTRAYIALTASLPVGATLSLQVNRKSTYPIDAADGLTSLDLFSLTFGNAPWEDA